MFIPLGFVQRSVLTSLGKMVYYTNQGELWATDGMGDTPSDTLRERETLIFFHGIGGGAFIELEDVGLNPELEVPEVIIGLIRKFLPVLRQ